MTKCQSIQMSSLLFLTVFITFAKIALNYQELMKNKLFALYFFVLLSGGIVSGSSVVYIGLNNNFGPSIVNVEDTSTSIDIIGVLLIDTFFGLVPNLFYSLYSTKLTKVTEEMTRKYFYANGIVLACIIIVLLITEFVGPNPIISTNVLIILETVYSLFFYVFVIVVMRNEEGRVEKILWRYFSYYCFYAVTLFVRNAVEITSAFYAPYTQVWWAIYPTDTILAGVTLMVVSMFLRDIKLSTNHQRQSKSTTKGSSLT